MEYVIQGWYGAQNGWEDLTVDETQEEAEQSLIDYNVNEPTYRHRIVIREGGQS